MKRTLIICLGCLLTVCGASSQVLTLSDCIRIGLENNRELLNSRLDIDRSRIAVTQNRSRLLPVINGAFQLTGFVMNPVNVTTGTLLGNDFQDNPAWQKIKSMPYNANAGIRMDVPLYNRTIFASVDVAKTVERISSLSYSKGVEELTVRIATLYYMAGCSLEQGILLDGNISRMEELYHITKALYDQGVVLEVDLSRIEINMQNLRAARGTYSMLYMQQLNMLKYLLDLPPEHDIEIARTPEVAWQPDGTGVTGELPELLLAREQQQLVDRRMRAVRAGYLPSVGLTAYLGGVGYQDRFSHFFHTSAASGNWFGNSFIGVSVNIPIFDANSKRHEIARYRIEARQASNRYEMLRDRLDTEYENARLRLEHNLEVYRTQQQSYRQAESVYALTAEQYREGVSSMTSLLQDEMQMRTAQSSCVEAHCQFFLARLELLRLSGNLSLLTE